MSNESLNSALVKAKICKPEDIAGCSEEEIASLECLAGIKFPSQYRWFLSKAGKAAGDFFKGTDIYVSALNGIKSEAASLIAGNTENFALPSDAFVFSMHQGYEFCFFCASDGEDPPVYQYIEGNGSPRVVWSSFSEFIRDAIRVHTLA